METLNLDIQPYQSKSHYGILIQIRILENLPNFSKHVWTPNKFSPNSNIRLVSGILIHIMFRI
jgi:hypothetical protein